MTYYPGAPFPFLFIGPKGEPEGLFPGGFPPFEGEFPLGTIAYGSAPEYEAISSSKASLANASYALALYRFRVAYEIILSYY